MCTVAPTWRSRGRRDGSQETRAGEKTRGEKETNVNNKPGDGGKPKHTEIARTQEMKSSRRPRGRGLARGGACPPGATLYSNEARTMQPRTQFQFRTHWQEARENESSCCEFEELPGSKLITRSSRPASQCAGTLQKPRSLHKIDTPRGNQRSYNRACVCERESFRCRTYRSLKTSSTRWLHRRRFQAQRDRRLTNY